MRFAADLKGSVSHRGKAPFTSEPDRTGYNVKSFTLGFPGLCILYISSVFDIKCQRVVSLTFGIAGQDGMEQIQWEIKKFNQLTVTELYELLRLRVDVFVVEQICPYPEMDGNDTHARTLHVAVRADRKLAAYLRVLAPGVSYPGVSFGRVVTARGFRGRGLSHDLIEKAVELARVNWPRVPIQIGAQEYLRAFYLSHGFEVISEIYDEDGIPHIDMIRKQD